MMSVPLLNKALSEPVSAHERWLSQQEAGKGMDMATVLKHLSPIPVSFGPLVQGSVRTVSMQFVNTGDVPVTWKLGGSDLLDLKLENWIEPARPQDAAEEHAAFILHNHLFCYHPFGGQLAVGESCVV
jgi:hypothetical protein